MAYQHKENTGSLFKNEKKEKDTHPNMTGTALIGGVEYWVSAWTNDGQKGKWQALAFKPKEESKPQAQPRAQQSMGRGRMDEGNRKAREAMEDDSIPF